MNSGQNRSILTALRIATATLILVAIAVQLVSAMRTPHFNPANFFEFFTILSNLFAAVVLLLAASATKLPSRRLDLLRGAAVLCLTIVGVFFTLLLANLESNVIPWVNVVVHYITPVAIVLDWLVHPPQTPLTIRDGLLWLLLPLAYISYTLLRGSIVHWYPYPFLNVDTNGYAIVFGYCAVIFVAALVVAVAVVAIGNTRRKKLA